MSCASSTSPADSRLLLYDLSKISQHESTVMIGSNGAIACSSLDLNQNFIDAPTVIDCAIAKINDPVRGNVRGAIKTELVEKFLARYNWKAVAICPTILAVESNVLLCEGRTSLIICLPNLEKKIGPSSISSINLDCSKRHSAQDAIRVSIAIVDIC